MPLSLFNPETLRCFRETAGGDEFDHTFGGDPTAKGIRFVNVERPLHLLYRLNLADPAVGIELPGVAWLPLCYGFGYAAHHGEMIYRVINDSEIELIAPADAEFDPDFPYENYPANFPESPLRFAAQPYDPTRAEDALSLAAIFGIDHLPEPEMQRAIQLVEKERLFDEWRTEMFSDWSDADYIRCMYKEPFMQGAPSKSCDNPSCTAEIAYRAEPHSITIPEDLYPGGGSEEDRTIHMEARDVRRASKQVFALHQPAADETLLWNDPYVQLIWQICDACGCITVLNQCT